MNSFADLANASAQGFDAYLLDHFVTGLDIDFDINYVSNPGGFVDIALDLTYWLPEAGINPLLGILDEAFGTGPSLPYNLVNNFPPFGQDNVLDAFSITSGAIAAVPEPPTLLLLGLSLPLLYGLRRRAVPISRKSFS